MSAAIMLPQKRQMMNQERRSDLGLDLCLILCAKTLTSRNCRVFVRPRGGQKKGAHLISAHYVFWCPPIMHHSQPLSWTLFSQSLNLCKKNLYTECFFMGASLHTRKERRRERVLDILCTLKSPITWQVFVYIEAEQWIWLPKAIDGF